MLPKRHEDWFFWVDYVVWALVLLGVAMAGLFILGIVWHFVRSRRTTGAPGPFEVKETPEP